MSFTVNGSAGGAGGSTSQSIALTVAGGHTIGCWIYFDSFGAGGSISSVTDSAGNTYGLGTQASGGSVTVGTACSIAIASPITSLTLNTVGAGGGYCAILGWDVTATGVITLADSKAAVDPSSAGGTDGESTGTLVLTSASGLLLGGCSDVSTFSMTPGTGFTQDAIIVASLIFGEHKATSISAPVLFTCGSAGDEVFVAGLLLQEASGGASFVPAGIQNQINYGQTNPLMVS